MFFEERLLSGQLPLEESVSNACKSRQLPGVVLVANGENFNYQEAFGSRSADEASDEPMETEATFVISACTQLMTTVAALQCVERGLLLLDADVTGILPEFRHKDIITGFDRKTDRPIFVRSTNIMTLRHLLTHTSGISYDTFNPLLRKWLGTQSRPSISLNGKVADTYNYPLIHEPGIGWSYGAGIDWVGKMVERATKMSLQQYMTTNIWNPLSMTTATFRLSTRPDLERAMPDFTHRLGLIHPLYNTLMSRNGPLISAREAEIHDVMTQSPGSTTSSEEYGGPDDDFGGGGMYCSAPDFARLLQSICMPSTNYAEVLLPSSIQEMFSPQLNSVSLAQLRSTVAIPEMGRVLGGLEQPTLVDWGLGGMLAMEDVKGEMGERRRGKGSLFWSAGPNIYWWADRGAGVSGVYASQLLPQGDRVSIEMARRFEETVYERIERRKKGKGKGKMKENGALDDVDVYL